jgi:hypothetical protein
LLLLRNEKLKKKQYVYGVDKIFIDLPEKLEVKTRGRGKEVALNYNEERENIARRNVEMQKFFILL